MKLELRLRVFAGVMILISIGLVYFVSPWWLLFTGFIGLNLIQSAFTGFCPPLWVLARLFPDAPGSCGCDDGKCGCDSVAEPKSEDSCGCGKH